MSVITYSFILKPKRYLVSLLAIVCILVACHLVLGYINYNIVEVPWLLTQLFHLDEENNIPTWFSSFLLLNVTFFLFLKFQSTSVFKTHWLLVSLGFLILSLDEVAGLHETFNTAIDISWVYPAAALLFVIGLFFVPFALSLSKFLFSGFLLSALVFFGGAIGVELVSEDMDEETFAYIVATAIEEGMEMIGACMFMFMSQNTLKDSAA
ncbi:MAG: hypothetical protein P8N51_04610 [Pseudomonadales bacterium]|nr:hypothetical protein [Pseudomonadales bacterium]